MGRDKFVYSIYDLNNRTHIAFFSSLNRALEFSLAHKLNIKSWDYESYFRYTGKKRAYLEYRTNNVYDETLKRWYTHIFVQIPLDKNGKLDLNV